MTARLKVTERRGNLGVVEVGDEMWDCMPGISALWVVKVG